MQAMRPGAVILNLPRSAYWWNAISELIEALAEVLRAEGLPLFALLAWPASERDALSEDAFVEALAGANYGIFLVDPRLPGAPAALERLLSVVAENSHELHQHSAGKVLIPLEPPSDSGLPLWGDVNLGEERYLVICGGESETEEGGWGEREHVYVRTRTPGMLLAFEVSDLYSGVAVPVSPVPVDIVRGG